MCSSDLAATLANRDATLALVRHRVAGGLASEIDLGQAQSLRADASLQWRELQRQRALFEHLLGTLTGRLDLTIEATDTTMLPEPPQPPPGLPSALLERRPDIRQAEQALVAANAQIGVARAAMLPGIVLTGSFGDESRALTSLFDSGSRIWSTGFGLTLPIFDWGRLSARADAAEARARQLVASYQKAAESAFREVSDALSSVAAGSEAEKDLQARWQAARNNARLAQLRFESGYAGQVELLDAQRTLAEAELAVLRNRQSRLSASVDLMKALGGGWTP